MHIRIKVAGLSHFKVATVLRSTVATHSAKQPAKAFCNRTRLAVSTMPRPHAIVEINLQITASLLP